MEVPERVYGSPAEGSQQLSEVVEVQLLLPSEAKPSSGFSGVLLIVPAFINLFAVKQ